MKKTTILIIWVLWAVSMTIDAQQVITGRVTDAVDGAPLAGAYIFISNTTIRTVSDESGNYMITIQGEGVYEIVVSYTGYETFFYKMDEPKSLHKIDVALETKELPEVVITAPKTYSQKDVDLFWRILLGVNPSRRGLEVLNPEKVFFYLNSDRVLRAFCSEPVLIINHETGYHIRYELKYFQHDYRTEEYIIGGTPHFEELEPSNTIQKRQWERRRRDVYSVSLTRFIRALYTQQLHENGFLLAISNKQRNLNAAIPITGVARVEQQNLVPVPETDILQIEQERTMVSIDSPVYLGCFSNPVTSSIIKDSYNRMMGTKYSFPVLILLPQQIDIYTDGTYSGILSINEIRNRISGLSAMLPIEYAY